MEYTGDLSDRVCSGLIRKGLLFIDLCNSQGRCMQFV